VKKMGTPTSPRAITQEAADPLYEKAVCPAT
jgi:hypothetical protein